MKKISILLGVVILIGVLTNITHIVALTKLYSFNQHKKVTTETRVITFEDIFETLHQQRGLAEELRHSKVNSLIGEEVQKGLDDASDYEMFLRKHPQINTIKVELPIVTYKDDDRTIEFISGKGKVLEVLEDGQWKEFNGTWDDLWKDLIEKLNEN
ncbi:hypothetical protein [[Bacillus] enclensis]|uniref:hypothetical protein n=1 Tax=[Bacillus] enclensis TaxID=1402860 RepID=UPI0018DDF0E9|nr:hypothetical protein [[Bacillus] enclensis]MBH9966757.1 hypothetical protein [[Bacillus] enclensis]